MSDINRNEESTESGVQVFFQKTEAETYAEAFENGMNTVADRFGEDEVFSVPSGCKAWYLIGEDDSRSLGPGTFRFHEGKMQKQVRGNWKPYRRSEDDGEFF